MPLALLLLGSLALLAAPGLVLVDRARESGLDVVTYSGGASKDHILESTGNGVLLLDYDGDGFLDAYFVNAIRFPRKGEREPHANVLYRNRGDGTFLDVTRETGVGLAAFGIGGTVGDFDEDGLPDLYVTNWGPNVLFRNNGDGTFTDVTGKAGVGESRWSVGATFFDADGDGDSDLFVANYIDATWEEVLTARRTRLWRGKVAVLDGPRGLRASRSTFYRNRGDGTFEDQTSAAGFGSGADYYSMGVVSFDYDGDGDVDLYVANDSTPNNLFRNRGDGTFEDVGPLSGAAYNADGAAQGSMGVDFGDFDGDGFFDLAVTNFAHDYYTLYRNLEGRAFQDDSFVAGIAVPTFVPLGWGSHFLDVDEDGDLDIFFSNGHIYPQVDEDPTLHETYRQKNLLLLNEGGKFRDARAEGGGMDVIESSRGAAVGDLDEDGDLDILVSNQDARPTYLRNESEGLGAPVSVELVDSVGTRLALGATIELWAGGKRQVREVASGAGYASHSDCRQHFGLGEHERIDKLVVRWLDGGSDTYQDLPARTRILLRRGAPPLLFPLGRPLP